MTDAQVIKIRRATRADASAVADVLRRSIIDLCGLDHQDDTDVIARWTRNKTTEGVLGWFESGQVALFVAVDGVRIAGVGGVTDDGEISLNYVAPDARFTGSSKALIAAMEAHLLGLGVAEVRLTSTQTAHEFYLGRGYEAVGEEMRVGDRVPVIKMRRVLSWPSQWWAITDAEHKRVFREELQSELGRGHPLKSMKLEPIARADGRDDYLFQAEDGRVAEVHLTFANRPGRPPWPRSVLYASLEAWLKAKEDDEQHG